MKSQHINELLVSLHSRRTSQSTSALGPPHDPQRPVPETSTASAGGCERTHRDKSDRTTSASSPRVLGPAFRASSFSSSSCYSDSSPSSSFPHYLSKQGGVIEEARERFKPSSQSVALAGMCKVPFSLETMKCHNVLQHQAPGRKHQKPSLCDPAMHEVLGGRFLSVEAVFSEAEERSYSSSGIYSGGGCALSVVIRSSLRGGRCRVVRRPLRDLHLLHSAMAHLVPDATMDYYDIFRPSIEAGSTELSLASLEKLSQWLSRLCRAVHTHPAALRSEVDIVEDFLLGSSIEQQRQEEEDADADGLEGRPSAHLASVAEMSISNIRSISRFRPDQLIKCGYLTKLGGDKAGGAGNWRRRFFALTEALRYFESEDDFRQGRPAKGCIGLVCFFVSTRETLSGHFEFTVHSLPHALVCLTDRAEDRDSWVRSLQNR